MSRTSGLRYRATAALGKGLIRLIELPVSLVVRDSPIFGREEFAWVQSVEEQWPRIREEYLRLASNPDSLPDISDISDEQKPVIAPGRWTFFPLRLYGIDLIDRQRLCPLTTKAVKSIPDCTTAFFSVLKPGAYIQPHRGAFKGFLRLHLGVVVPQEQGKCGLNIGESTYHWEEGRSLLFDDTFMHDAFNNAGTERVVLYVDFIRPMPNWLKSISRWLTRLIARSAYVQGSVRNLRQREIQSEPKSLA